MNYSEEQGKKFIQKMFEESVVPSLSQFVSIPNLSRLYDKDYKTNGLLEKAAAHLKTWIQGIGLKGLKTEIINMDDMTPLLLCEIEGEIKDKTILFYGHFDKQPHGTGWDADKHPTKPVIHNNKLYGRGSSDDGYNIYASGLAIKALQEQKVPLPRVIFINEGDEQSGGHMEVYLQKLKDRLGKVDIVTVLDCTVVDYERLWLCKSLRGIVHFNVKVTTLVDGVHSGDGSGIVPSTFNIANKLIERLENVQTGEVNSYFHVNVPSNRYQEFYQLARDFGTTPLDKIQTVQGLQKLSKSALDLYINKGWKPTLTVIGLTGFPPVATAGNLMLPTGTFGLSLRIPPTFPRQKVEPYLRELLTTNTPYGCSVEIGQIGIGEGWNAPDFQPWLQEAIQTASKTIFGSKAYSVSEGGAVPIVNSFAKVYPAASFIVTGALGPDGNAHSANENLDLPYTSKLIRSLAYILGKSSEHYRAS